MKQTGAAFTSLTQQLVVHHGCANVGVLRSGDAALLIDAGNGDVRTLLDDMHIARLERILLTHHHRDSASGIAILAQPQTRIAAPAQEAQWISQVEAYWAGLQYRWHLYNVHPHNLMLAASVSVHDALQDGDVLAWGEATITVLDTPGHTDGSVSYLLDLDGNRIAFCGDLIYAPGKLWELYSLQKGSMGLTDYHGFMGDRERRLHSLDRLLSFQPHILVPAHGDILREPAAAVAELRTRLEASYDQYVAISALRYYFPDYFKDHTNRTPPMPFAATSEVPSFLRHIGTSWILLSEAGEAFVMDCGTLEALNQITELQGRGDFKTITGCWITHYHDDHVDAMPQFQAAYPCPTYTIPRVAQVIERPHAYRLPCQSPAVVRVDHQMHDGASWRWNEFRLTAYTFPGQTYYHAGLLVEGHGLRLFFGGDSFTPSGIDDYCMGNRNLLGSGAGYDNCLALLELIEPTHIFNCHVNSAFRFSPQELTFMRANLAARERTFAELLPWDHANYGLDEQWVRCHPYEQQASAGAAVSLRVEFTNHSTQAKLAICRPVLPSTWGSTIPAAEAVIPANQDGGVLLRIPVPAHVRQSERIVIPIDITYDGQPLGQFREAILVVQPR
jgi:glyoxylase-like metal-dependent hydrolase (beta-lactamase superfamily II)